MAADYYEGNVSFETINAHNRGADAPLSVILMSYRVLSLQTDWILKPVPRPVTPQVLGHPEHRHICRKARELQTRLDHRQRAS